MKAIDAIRTALATSDRWVKQAGRDEGCAAGACKFKTSNHAMWVLGHTTVVEGRLHKTLFGTPNPVEHWKPLFDAGSEPSDDPAVYPPFEEVVREIPRAAQQDIAYVNTLSDADLDRPVKNPPPGLEKPFATVGSALLTIALHQAFHNGESSVARRASGKQPVFVPTKEFRES